MSERVEAKQTYPQLAEGTNLRSELSSDFTSAATAGAAAPRKEAIELAKLEAELGLYLPTHSITRMPGARKVTSCTRKSQKSSDNACTTIRFEPKTQSEHPRAEDRLSDSATHTIDHHLREGQVTQGAVMSSQMTEPFFFI
jgi:hypothetical protein